MKKMHYEDIQVQAYFTRCDINTEQKKLIFKYRTRMAEFGENFRGGREQVLCHLCNNHLDKQELSYSCTTINKNIKIEGDMNEIYSDHISKQTVETIEQITNLRKLLTESQSILPQQAHVSLGLEDSSPPSAAQDFMSHFVPFSREILD